MRSGVFGLISAALILITLSACSDSNTQPPAKPSATIAPTPTVTPSASNPITVKIGAVSITVSSQHETYGPRGLLSADQTWHAKSPLSFPEYIVVDFGDKRKFGTLKMLPQEGDNLKRFPKQVEVSISDDGRTWVSAASAGVTCNSIGNDTWFPIKLKSEAETKYVKINILSNCGDPNLTTVRGIKFE